MPMPPWTSLLEFSTTGTGIAWELLSYIPRTCMYLNTNTVGLLIHLQNSNWKLEKIIKPDSKMDVNFASVGIAKLISTFKFIAPRASAAIQAETTSKCSYHYRLD